MPFEHLRKRVNADIERIGEHLGCSFDGCENHEIWLIIAGVEGTSTEGCYSFICSDHARQMTTFENDEEVHVWMKDLKYVTVFGGVDVNPN